MLVWRKKPGPLFPQCSAFLPTMPGGQGTGTFKVCSLAISSCHKQFGDRPVFTHLVKCFLKGGKETNASNVCLFITTGADVGARCLTPMSPWSMPLNKCCQSKTVMVWLQSKQWESWLPSQVTSVVYFSEMTVWGTSLAKLLFSKKNLRSSFRLKVIRLDAICPPPCQEARLRLLHAVCTVSILRWVHGSHHTHRTAVHLV